MNEQFIFFFGNAPLERNYRCLSQWWPSRFFVDGVEYSTAEHFMMAGKARLFGDAKSLTDILNAETPKQAKELGRHVKAFDLRQWEMYREGIVFEGNLAKFRQNPPMKDVLLGTGNLTIVESSPDDCIWGIGLPSDDPRASDRAQWRGLNLLGTVLMNVRKSLRQ